MMDVAAIGRTGVAEPGLAPEPLALKPAAWRRYLVPLISLTMLAICVKQIIGIDLDDAVRLVPRSAGFWLLFAAYYFMQPAADWVIFRRLWNLPAVGFLALVRKAVSNEVLLGYSGELYFYGWARRHARLSATPFGAIKDVTILSAATGNAVTLALLAVSWPLLGGLNLGLGGHIFALSIGTVTLSSLAALLFRRTLFSLTAADLRFVATVHVVRVLGSIALGAVLWHYVMPGAPLIWWLMLATLKQLVSRLPFIPNKDIVFAGVAVFLIGRQAEVVDLMAMMAALVLATHLVLGATLALGELLGLERGIDDGPDAGAAA